MKVTLKLGDFYDEFITYKSRLQIGAERLVL